jgi:hypothetical protein
VSTTIFKKKIGLNSLSTNLFGFHQINLMVSHTQCANFMEKLEASSNVDLFLHESPSAGLINLLRSDTDDTLFLWE